MASIECHNINIFLTSNSQNYDENLQFLDVFFNSLLFKQQVQLFTRMKKYIAKWITLLLLCQVKIIFKCIVPLFFYGPSYLFNQSCVLFYALQSLYVSVDVIFSASCRPISTIGALTVQNKDIFVTRGNLNPNVRILILVIFNETK